MFERADAKQVSIKGIVDNPGGGDCGFYSIAIAIIPILKRELRKAEKTPVFNTLIDKMKAVNPGFDETKFIQSILQFDYHHQNTQFLMDFNLNLRKVLVAERLRVINSLQEIKDIKEIKKCLEKDTLFSQEILPVFYYFYANGEDATRTDVYRFRPLQEKLKQIAEKMLGMVPAPTEDQIFSEIFDNLLKKPKNGSPSLYEQFLDEKKKPFNWATNDDLMTLISCINRSLTKDNQLTAYLCGKGTYDPNCRQALQAKEVNAILIRHANAFHWNTFITQQELLNEVFYQSIPESAHGTRPLSVKEIKTIFNCYTDDNSSWNRFWRGHWNRHHIQFANRVVDLCDKKQKPGEVLQVIMNYIENHKQHINPNGELMHIVNYLKERTTTHPFYKNDQVNEQKFSNNQRAA